jgi:hypothetical protein
VDRTRVVSAELARVAPNAKSYVVCRRQLEALRARWTLVLRALKLFYVSLGSFASATLVSLIGAVFASSGLHLPFPFIALFGLVSGTLGVAGLVFGCSIMVQEARLGLQNLEEEARLTAPDPRIHDGGGGCSWPTTLMVAAYVKRRTVSFPYRDPTARGFLGTEFVAER